MGFTCAQCFQKPEHSYLALLLESLFHSLTLNIHSVLITFSIGNYFFKRPGHWLTRLYLISCRKFLYSASDLILRALFCQKHRFWVSSMASFRAVEENRFES